MPHPNHRLAATLEQMRGTLGITLPQGACDTLHVVPLHRGGRGAGGPGHGSATADLVDLIEAEVNAWLTAQLDKRRKTAF